MPRFPERPPNMLENKHCPEYEIHKAPCTKHSISIEVFLQIYSISVKESSLERTTLLKPNSWSFKAPFKLWIVIWVLPCIGKSGNNSISFFAKPRSWIIIASIPNSYALLANFMALSNSLSLINVFKVKLVLTPLNFAYSIAFFNSASSKLWAKALALNKFAPK